MSDKDRIERATALIDEMLEVATEKDNEHKQRSMALGQAERTVGESWEIFYLKMVRDILNDGAV